MRVSKARGDWIEVGILRRHGFECVRTRHGCAKQLRFGSFGLCFAHCQPSHEAGITMQHLRCVAALFTANVYFGILAALAAEPNVDAPPELEFAPQCKTKPAEPFASGPTTILPRFISDNPPHQPPYPAKFRERRVVGTIHMLLLVNEQGRVTRVRLVQSTGYPELDQLGLESTRDWKLAPGIVDGKAQCMWQQFTLTWGTPPGL